MNIYQCPYEESTTCKKTDEPCGLCDVFTESNGVQYLLKQNEKLQKFAVKKQNAILAYQKRLTP